MAKRNRGSARRRSKVRETVSQGARALQALASGALALPGLSGVAWADAPPERPEADARYSRYWEDDLPGHRVAGGNASERYTIDVFQFQYATPFGARSDLGLNFVWESMSGASPISVDTSNRVVMSGATIEEERLDFRGGGNYYFDEGRVGGSIGYSTENDYDAVSLAVDGSRNVNNGATTLLGGLAMSFDDVSPTQQGGTAPRLGGDKQSYTVFAGLAQVLTRTASLQATATYRYSTGFLSDPYKQAFVGGGPLADTRPNARNQVALLVRARKHFDQVNGTLHGDFQYAFDDWGINAATVELAWHQTVFEALRLVPQFRYYSQSQADFYNTTFPGPTAPRHFSSDFRLSPFGALTYGLKAETNFRGILKTDWELALSYDRYVSDADLALGSVSVENPGLVAYHLVSFRVTGRF